MMVILSLENFPYLSMDSLKEEEKAELVIKLSSDTEEMKEKFTILVSEAKGIAETKGVTVGDITLMIRNLDLGNKLLKELRKLDDQNITEAFFKMSKYW